MEQEIKTHQIKQAIPWSETCFGCNGGPNEGIGMRAFITEDGYIVGVCKTKEAHQGFPGVLHGGIIGTYFDEVFWHATRVQNQDLLAMTVEMNVRYHKPVGLGVDVRIVAEPARFEGRHVYVKGYLLLPDEQIAATAEVHYIQIRQNHELNDSEPVREKHNQVELQIKSIRF